MPVNMDPKKRRKAGEAIQTDRTAKPASQNPGEGKPTFEETEADREKALADAEWKNLWDATEVIDMDRW